MNDFKIGDQVEGLDDDLKGIVKSIDGQIITVEDEIGFTFKLEQSQLIKCPEEHNKFQLSYQDNDFKKVITEKEQSLIKSIKSSKTDKSNSVFEVDLHIHQLTDSTKGMGNYDMLNLQINTAQKQLEFAIKKRIPKMVFIHGVGEGVLKMELHTLLRRYDNLEFYDADFKTYGYGATEVRIYRLNS